MNHHSPLWDAIIVGAGPAGLSAAIYLGRSKRRTLLLHSAHSMAKWEKDIQNYLGFPDGIDGEDLLARGFHQIRRFQVQAHEDTIQSIQRENNAFVLAGTGEHYRAKRVLLATGITHLPPEIEGVRECLGQSLFFCKDCDAYRVQGKRIVIIGHNCEAAEYALAMLLFTSRVMICTNGKTSTWPQTHQDWLRRAGIPVSVLSITAIVHEEGRLKALTVETGKSIHLDAAFTTRGDVCHNDLAASAGAKLDSAGQIIVDACMNTSIPGLYAAGCVTPANCQMIIAAGEGAIAGQAMNRDLFEESLRNNCLPRFSAESEAPDF